MATQGSRPGLGSSALRAVALVPTNLLQPQMFYRRQEKIYFRFRTAFTAFTIYGAVNPYFSINWSGVADSA